MKKREPDFENILKVLKREPTESPVPFELYMNYPLFVIANGRKPDADDFVSMAKFTVEGYANLGYDYATLKASEFGFLNEKKRKSTISLNDAPVISDWASFESYNWPDPNACDYSVLEKVRSSLTGGMKLMIMGPGGVLENVQYLVGYDNLCFMLYEDPELLERIFNEVGARLYDYYRNALMYDTVGFISSNDDWGFNTQTFLKPSDMRKFVFPWHKKIVDLCHNAGKPIILHSCGYINNVFEDIVDMKYDAKHSFEDGILPIENAYEDWHERIALLGGIDVNFLCTRTEEEIRIRTAKLIEQTGVRGGWAAGSGNSIPEYVPVKSYLAMLSEILGYNPIKQ